MVSKKESIAPEDKLLQKILSILEDKKAHDIRIFNVTELTGYTDYFVFCTGTSNTNLRAMQASLHKELRTEKLNLGTKINENSDSGWVAVDCGMVVVHCFGEAERAYYNLEELWKNACNDGRDRDSEDN